MPPILERLGLVRSRIDTYMYLPSHVCYKFEYLYRVAHTRGGLRL